MNLLLFLKILFKPRGKYGFIYKQKQNCIILDIGCGNNSVIPIKQIIPCSKYIGIDIHDYNQSDKSKKLMDNYFVLKRKDYNRNLKELNIKNVDVIILNHSIEHLDTPYSTLSILLHSLKKGGSIYFAFPCSESIFFPHRHGTLNFYDDPTHKKPVNIDKLLKHLKKKKLNIIYKNKRYRPLIPFVIGMFTEIFSFMLKKILPGTWALYGFETIIIAKKK